MGPVEVLWDGDGSPSPERTCDQWKYYGMVMGPPLQNGHVTSGSIMGWRWGKSQPPANRQTPVKT